MPSLEYHPSLSNGVHSRLSADVDPISALKSLVGSMLSSSASRKRPREEGGNAPSQSRKKRLTVAVDEMAEALVKLREVTTINSLESDEENQMDDDGQEDKSEASNTEYGDEQEDESEDKSIVHGAGWHPYNYAICDRSKEQSDDGTEESQETSASDQEKPNRVSKSESIATLTLEQKQD